MFDKKLQLPAWAKALRISMRGLIFFGLLALVAAVIISDQARRNAASAPGEKDVTGRTERTSGVFFPSATQWAAITLEPVERRVFRSENITEGKISIDEDRSTPIFSPYAGRATRLLVKPGDTVERGQPLFVVEATDTVGVQNDFMAAVNAANKARSQLQHMQIVEKRQRDLYEGKAVALKEWQQAQADLNVAQNDSRTAESALEAARNRLRLLGRTDPEIATFQEAGRISPETTIYAPIAGTIVQRKIGPGQYVGTGAADPVYIIGDLSTVWLVAYVRERDASMVRVGQPIQFTVLALPQRVYESKIAYVAASLDPNTRRLLVRATIDNRDQVLKPEMFASVNILVDPGEMSLAVPRDAVIYEGDTARVWVARDDKTLEVRKIKIGAANGRLLQVLEGLAAEDRIVTKGSIFVDRAASGS